MANKTVILLLGETGSGKSTFLNYLANFFLEGSLTKTSKYSKVKTVVPNSIFPKVTDKIAEYSENNVFDKTKSQTSKPVVYPFKHKEDNSQFHVIDTPGFGDTDRTKDETNLQSIFLEASQQPFISAIVLIINGTIARETTSLKFVLESIKGSVPDSLLKNVILVFTNCSETTKNFPESLLKDLKSNHVFYMQNNAFSNDLNNASEKLWRQLENEWENSMETMESFVSVCKSMSQASAADFAKMRIEREKMQRVCGEIITEIKHLFQVVDIIEKTNMEKKNAEDRGETYKNFKKTEKIKVKEMKKTDYFSTACQEHLNEKVCHENCGLGLMQTCNENHFLRCAAASGHNCRVCNCLMKIHYHIFEIPVEVEKDQEVIIQDMKAKYEKANMDLSTATTEIQKNEQLKKVLEREIQNKKRELNATTSNLKSLCRNFNFHEELKGISSSLEKEAKIARDFKQKKEFEDMSNAIKQMISA
jgi:energy-coupling factor transporter ATP-binding protein EcfA2